MKKCKSILLTYTASFVSAVCFTILSSILIAFILGQSESQVVVLEDDLGVTTNYRILKNDGGFIVPVKDGVTIGSSTVDGAFNDIIIDGICTGTGCGGGGGGGDISQLGQIGDVSTSTPMTYGEILRYNTANNKWESVATSSLGISGSGTVSSVDMSVPTGLTISGNPITTSGTLALDYDAGYSAVLSASSTNWESFYDTPSSRINAGDHLSWTANALNVSDDWWNSLDDMTLAEGNVYVGNSSNNPVATSTIFIDTTENVGIGTISPAYQLTVDGSLYSNDYKGITADDVAIQEIGTATYDDSNDFMSITQSAGKISGWNVSDGGSGTLDITAGSGYVRSADSEIGQILSFDLGPTTSLALLNNSNNWIYVDYNSGSPQFAVTADLVDIDFNTKILIGQAYRIDLVVTSIDAGPVAYNTAYKTARRIFDVYRVQRASGLVLGEEGTRNISSTAGSVYYGTTEQLYTSLDTSASDTFTSHYHSGGSWTTSTGQTQIDNVYYDNGTNLAEVGIAKYGVFWTYMSFDNELHIVYGTDSYSLIDAEASQEPAALPDFITSFAFLTGRIIILRNDSSFTEISSAFATTFTQQAADDHSELSNLQGGATDEYYHLTSSAYTIVGNTSGTNSGDVTLAGTPNYLTLAGQVITQNVLDVSDDTNLTVTSPITLTGDDIGLNQSAITSLGTIATGIWNGSPLTDSYISSAITWNAKQDALTFGIADTNSVVIDSASVASGEYAKFTVAGLESQSIAEVKTDLSLNLVENTALSTWAGSSNLTTLGTITNGIWNGNTLTDAYVAAIQTISLQVDSKLYYSAAAVIDSVGESGIDLTSDQFQYYGSAKRVITYLKSPSAIIEELAADDDNMPLGTNTYARTITKVGCRCIGTCTTKAQISLEDSAGNAMTHTIPTCATTGAVAYQAVSAGGALIAGEGLAFDVDNTPSPETDTYEILFEYTVDSN